MREVRKFVGEEYLKNFGEPSVTVRLQGEEAADPKRPAILDLFIWYPDRNSDLTTFATCGMAQIEIQGVEYRSELLFAMMGKPTPEKEREILEFLGNLALYPIGKKEPLQWWFSMEMTGEVPGFPKCNSVVLHPPFNEQGWAVMHFDLFDIQLFNVVPLTEQEHRLKKEKGVNALQQYLANKQVNIFKPR